MVSPLIVLLGPSMILGNYLVQKIPQARNIFNTEATPEPDTGYRAAQAQLLRVTRFVSPLGLVVALISALVSQ